MWTDAEIACKLYTCDELHLSDISNSYWTKWSTIQGVIAQVRARRARRAKRKADLKLRARLLPEVYNTRSNY